MWKVVGAAISALVVGVLLHLLKEGGIRRARRRNITEELKLLELLDKDSAPAVRLRQRIDVMLEQYEPETRESSTSTKGKGRVALELVGLVIAAVVAQQFFEPTSRPAALVLGGMIAATFMGVEAWWSGRLDRVEQDEAIRSSADIRARATIEADGVVSTKQADPTDDA